MGLCSDAKSEGICINLTSSGFRPTLLQNALQFNIVALIINVFEHFSNRDLQYIDISNGFSSTLTTSKFSFFISDTIQFFGFDSILFIVLVSRSVCAIKGQN
jgi:hypothetical protein